jgi:hypothetical protein
MLSSLVRRIPKRTAVCAAAATMLAAGTGVATAQPSKDLELTTPLASGEKARSWWDFSPEGKGDWSDVTPESVTALAKAVSDRAMATPSLPNVVVFSRSVLNHRRTQGGAQGVDEPLLDSLATLVATALERSAVNSLITSPTGSPESNTVPTPHPSRVLLAFSSQLKTLPDVRQQEAGKEAPPEVQWALATLHAKVGAAVNQKMVDLIAEGGLGPEESPSSKVPLERTLPALADIVVAYERLGFSLSPALLEVIRRRFRACVELARKEPSGYCLGATHVQHVLAIVQGLRSVSCLDPDVLASAVRAAFGLGYSHPLSQLLAQALAEVQVPSEHSAEAGEFLHATLKSFVNNNSLEPKLVSQTPVLADFCSLVDRCCEAGVEVPGLVELLDMPLHKIHRSALESPCCFPSAPFVQLVGTGKLSFDSLEIAAYRRDTREDFVGRYLHAAAISQRKQLGQKEAALATVAKEEEKEDTEEDFHSPWESSYRFQRLVSKAARRRSLRAGLYLYDDAFLDPTPSTFHMRYDAPTARRLLREVVLRQAGGVKTHGLEPCWWRGPNINMVVLVEPSSSSGAAAVAPSVAPSVKHVEQPPLSPRLLLQDKALKAVLGKAAPTEKGLLDGSTLPPLTVIRIKEDQLKKKKDEKGKEVIDTASIDKAFEEAGVWQKLVEQKETTGNDTNLESSLAGIWSALRERWTS